MKRLAFKILLPTILLGLLGAASSYAQIENRIDVNVPFSFYVGNTLLPAGSYTVRPMSDSPQTLLVGTADGKVEVLVGTFASVPADAPKNTSLVFDELAGKQFLSMIWVEGWPTGYGYHVIPSRIHEQLINSEPGHSHRYAEAAHIRNEK